MRDLLDALAGRDERGGAYWRVAVSNCALRLITSFADKTKFLPQEMKVAIFPPSRGVAFAGGEFRAFRGGIISVANFYCG